MPQLTQKDRPIQVQTVLGEDELLLVSMTGTEQLSGLFRYELEMISPAADIAVNDLLGTKMTVGLKLRNDETRHFNGHVSRFTYAGYDGEYFRYRATLVPWVWFLTRTTDCRIFQDLTALEIIKRVFNENDHVRFEERLSDYYSDRTWEYCVQYRETDFNFVSRLLEQEGIYYYFTHEQDKHTLVLCDSRSAHDPLPGYETIKYHHSKSHVDEDEVVYEWRVDFEFPVGKVALRDFNFTDPDPSKLEVRKSTTLETPGADGYEMYDYPGEYTVKDEGDTYSQVRMQELDAHWEAGHGRSNARGVGPGGTFELARFRRDDQNRGYLITSVTYDLRSDLDQGQRADKRDAGGDIFDCVFDAIDVERQYRPPPVTPKPVVQGPQTAVVVGNAGEKVHVDEHGRVKVQFHWDREGGGDENSSCWVRVSQNSAGKGWGSMFIPNIGHEVIVEFLEGDPDRPIITGRVYNNDNIPPRLLPSHKYESVIRDEYGNEIVFDSTPDAEHIRLYSPHHDSALILGESIKFTTQSDWLSFTIGCSFGVTIGAAAEVFLGLKAEAFLGGQGSFFLGASIGVWLGASFEFTGGIKVGVTIAGSISWNRGFSFTHNSAKEIEYGSDTFTKRVTGDILIDSNTELTLVAGTKPLVPATDTTPAIPAEEDKAIIYMGPKKLEIGFGEGDAKRAPESIIWNGVKMFSLGALGVVAGVSAAAASVAGGALLAKGASSWHGDQNDPSQEGRDQEATRQEVARSSAIDWAGWSVLGVATATSLVSTAALVGISCFVFKGADLKEPKHKTGGQQITLTDKLIKLAAGDKKAVLQLHNEKETVVLRADKQVGIRSVKDALRLMGKTKVIIEGTEVQAMKGKFTTKNIMDMG